MPNCMRSFGRWRWIALTGFGLLAVPATLFAFQPLFDTVISYDVGSFPSSVFAADLNGDGFPDLATANFGEYPAYSSTVSVLKNNGDGTFADKVDYWIGGHANSIFTANLDGDAKPDLAVTSSYGGMFGGYGGAVSILKNNGDGAFAAPVDYGTRLYPRSVFATDLDGDGDNDLAVANGGDNTVSVLTNSGDGTFSNKIDYATGVRPQPVLAADLGGDEKPDLVVANWDSKTVSILKNNDDGTFAPKVDYETGALTASVFAADLVGDGDLDLVAANSGNFTSCGWGCIWFTPDSTVSILKNNGDGTFAAKVNYGTGSYPTSVFAADLDGDGDKDLATAISYDSTVSILKNLSGPYYAKGDMDGDGNLGATDVVLMLNCVFLGTGSCSLFFTDANCSGNLTPADVVLELNLVFLGTPLPC